MPLHTDYRPKSLNGIVGNETTIKSLKEILRRENPPQTYLLTGPSGCGKTTIARIIARMFGAYDPSVEVNMDYVELDAADFRGIDTIREIRRRMNYQPMLGNYRVWLLDECHQITPDGQEALLKALEHPPKTAVFILATTEPDKLKVTLRRRCIRFDLTPVEPDDLEKYLCRIIRKYKKSELNKGILDAIISRCHGSVGVALAMLDRVIDLTDEESAEELKKTDRVQAEAIQLCRVLIQREKWKDVAKILERLKKEDVENVRRAVLGYASTVLLKNGSPQAAVILDLFIDPFYNSGFPGLIHACYTAVQT